MTLDENIMLKKSKTILLFHYLSVIYVYSQSQISGKVKLEYSVCKKRDGKGAGCKFIYSAANSLGKNGVSLILDKNWKDDLV